MNSELERAAKMRAESEALEIANLRKALGPMVKLLRDIVAGAPITWHRTNDERGLHLAKLGLVKISGKGSAFTPTELGKKVAAS